ncbi:MAG: penicillin-binding protein 2 [Candidatus Portnoybacteria bacterium]|nr:penicillin-binding protein 2 [Candidatus Portnoybacteria bacterium]
MKNPFRKYRVRGDFVKDVEPEEILMDSQRLKESPESEREKLEKPIKNSVLRAVLFFSLLILTLLLAKAFHLQIVQGDYWLNMAENNRIKSYPIKPLRGIIYDRNGEVLAANVAKLDLMVAPKEFVSCDDFDGLVDSIAEILGVDREELAGFILDNSEVSYPLAVAEDLDREQALLVESRFSDISCVSIEKNNWREYEDGEYFSHVLGYLGKVNKEEAKKEGYFLNDYIGRTGLEKTYEDRLRGEYGARLVEVDNLGNIQRKIAVEEPVVGNDLILSIDAGLQRALYSAIKNRIRGLSSRAAAVALDPRNGEVLAMVSLPSFDNNDFIHGFSKDSFSSVFENPDQPLFNRAISGVYPPASTIKPLIAAGVLEEDVIDPNRRINCPGVLNIPDKYNPGVNWTFGDWKVHGIVNMKKAIAESCNVYFYTIGGGAGDIEGLGIDKIKEYLEAFGWNNSLGIDLSGEEAGFIPTPEWKEEKKGERWYVGDTYNASIGQGDVGATPLQVAVATAAIANRGMVLEPHLIKDEKVRVLNKGFLSSRTLDIVRDGMREAVITGSAKYLGGLPVKAAGKTGTAETFKGRDPHSWFTVFAPYDDPEIVLTVIVENGGGGSGSAVSIAFNALNWWFSK